MRTSGIPLRFDPAVLRARRPAARPRRRVRAGVLATATGGRRSSPPKPVVAPAGRTHHLRGVLLLPGRASVYFDGNIMVRSGSYRGVPLYTDTTIEADPRAFVPLAGGVLQPNQRKRTGDAAGTTGSRAPSFPVTMAGEPAKGPEVVGTAGTSPNPPPPSAGGMAPNAEPPATRASSRRKMSWRRAPRRKA